MVGKAVRRQPAELETRSSDSGSAICRACPTQARSSCRLSRTSSRTSSILLEGLASSPIGGMRGMIGKGLFSILSIGIMHLCHNGGIGEEYLLKTFTSTKSFEKSKRSLSLVKRPFALPYSSWVTTVGGRNGLGSWAIMDTVSTTQRTGHFGRGVSFGKNLEVHMESSCSMRRYGWQIMKWLYVSVSRVSEYSPS